MAMAPYIQDKLFDKKTRTNMSKIVFNCNSIKSSDIRQEQTCCQDIATVCISNSQYLGFGGPWVSAVSALVFSGNILPWGYFSLAITYFYSPVEEEETSG